MYPGRSGGMRRTSRIPTSFIVLPFTLLFTLLVFALWVLLGLGIAERVVVVLALIPLFVGAVIKFIALFGERRR